MPVAGNLIIKNDTYFSYPAVGRALRHSSYEQPVTRGKCCSARARTPASKFVAQPGRPTVNLLIPMEKIVMANSRNNFVWYDVMTTDTKAAEAFYSSVVGWGAQDAGMPDRSYTILHVKETPIGG